MPTRPSTHIRPRRNRKAIHEQIGQGEEGTVWKVREAGQRKSRVVKYFHTHPNEAFRLFLEKQFIARQIAHLLFPNNIPKPVSLDLHLHPARATYKFRKPNPELEEFQRVPKHGDMVTLNFLRSQVLRISPHGRSRLDKIQRAGFGLDTHATNLGTLNPDEPIVYEIETLNINAVREYTMKQAMPVRLRRRILKLLTQYNRMQKNFQPEQSAL